MQSNRPQPKDTCVPMNMISDPAVVVLIYVVLCYLLIPKLVKRCFYSLLKKTEETSVKTWVSSWNEMGTVFNVSCFHLAEGCIQSYKSGGGGVGSWTGNLLICSQMLKNSATRIKAHYLPHPIPRCKSQKEFASSQALLHMEDLRLEFRNIHMVRDELVQSCSQRGHLWLCIIPCMSTALIWG